MPSAFVVMPYKQPFEKVYSDVIKPVLVEAGIAPVRADQKATSTDIAADVQDMILESDLVIIEATHPNPNVYFEFGYAMAKGKEFVAICQTGTELPFDTAGIRHLTYDQANLDLLKQDLHGISTTRVAQLHKKRSKHSRMIRGEVFPEVFDAAVLTEQFSAPIEKVIWRGISKGEMIPCSIAYSTDTGSDSWLRLCEDPLYSVFHESMGFLNSYAGAIFDSLPQPFMRSYPDFVSLGPGNGFKDRTLLRALSHNLSNQGLSESIYYYPVDISARILATAISTISRDPTLEARLKIKALVGDFEELRLFAPVYDYRPEPNLFSLLGNTLGNLPNDWAFLKKLYRTMHAGDVLLLEVRTKQGEIELSGRSDNQYGLSFAPLSHLGVPYEKAKVRTAHEDGLSQIPGTLSLAVHYEHFDIRGNAIEDLILSWVNFYDDGELEASLIGKTKGFKLLKRFASKSLAILVLQK
jgi:hypothetical protein